MWAEAREVTGPPCAGLSTEMQVKGPQLQTQQFYGQRICGTIPEYSQLWGR